MYAFHAFPVTFKATYCIIHLVCRIQPDRLFEMFSELRHSKYRCSGLVYVPISSCITAQAGIWSGSFKIRVPICCITPASALDVGQHALHCLDPVGFAFSAFSKSSWPLSGSWEAGTISGATTVDRI
jgi:hypothetical protein